MNRWHLTLAALALATPPLAAGPFLPPVPLQADGKPLDVQREGHSAPFVGDFDGDGKRDLLVGQYDEGRLRIYRNVGTDAKPRFTSYTWLRAGGEDARVPEG
jgi:hypothetical protein